MTHWLIPSASDLSAISAEATVVCTIVAMLIAAMVSPKRSNLTSGAIALAGVVVAWFVVSFHASIHTGAAFSNAIISDSSAVLWKQMLLIFVIGVIGVWFTSTRIAMRDGEAPEFFTLLLSSTVGMMLMGSTSNLLMILLAMEIASMPTYVLAGFRKTQPRSAEASLKFVLFGGVCTAVMVYGMSLLYGTHASLDVSVIASQFAHGVPPTSVVALGMIGVGLLFKLSAVPLHFWCPDVFEGAHVDVAAFLSVASKGAAVVLLARLGWMLSEHSTEVAHAFAITIAALGVLTTTVGNLGALRQTSVKRLLAYSSIAHAGYLMCALAIVRHPDAMTTTAIYLLVYLAMNLGAFAVLAGVERRSGNDAVASFNGLSRSSPLSAIAMTVCLISMVGLPPTAGVIAKLKIMAIYADIGSVGWAVVAAVALNSVISLAYYAKIIRAMYLTRDPDANAIPLTRTEQIIPVACAVVLVLMLIGFAGLERLAGYMNGFADK